MLRVLEKLVPSLPNRTFLVVPSIIGSFLLLDIDLVSALLALLWMAVLTEFGRTLIAHTKLADDNFGIGFIVGVGVFVFASQALLLLVTRPHLVNWTIVIFMLGVIVGKRRTQRTETRKPKPTSGEILFELSLTLTVLAIRHPWLFPFALSLVASDNHRASRLPGRVVNWVVTALVPIAWLISFAIRPERWWYFYQGNDAQYFEAIGWSIAHWGVFEHPGFAGGSVASYHWLAYALTGALSHVAMFAPWEALLKVGPPLLVLLLVALLRGSPYLYRLRAFSLPWLVLVLTLGVMPTARLDSFAFSIPVAICFLLVANSPTIGKMCLSKLALLCLLALTLIFAKVTTAIVVAGCLAAMLLLQMIRKEKSDWLPVICLIGSLVIAWLTTFRGHSAGESVFSFSPSLWKTIDEFVSLASNPVIGLLAFLAVLLPFLGRIEFKRIQSLSWAIVSVGVLAVILASLQANSTSAYFGLPCIYFALGTITRKMFQPMPIAEAENSRLIRVLGMLAVSLGVTIGFFYQWGLISFLRIDDLSRSTFSSEGFVGRVIRSSGYFYLLALLMLIALLWIKKSRFNLVVISVAMALGTYSGQSSNAFQRTADQGIDAFSEWSFNSSPFGNSDLIAVGDFVRSNTSEELVLASNNFCCAGAEWWNEITVDLEAHTKYSGEDKWGGANYLLPAETRRRFLVQGLRFQTGYEPATAEQIRRMSLSLDFANNPTRQITAELKAYGVSGFVVNLSLTDNRDWSNFAIEKFRSGNFLYLELN